jgi:hypothetical protein
MEWNQTLRHHIECAVEDNELAGFLHDSICFAEGTTLRDLLMLVFRDSDLFEIIAACDCLNELAAELGEKADTAEEIAALEVSWGATTVANGRVPVMDDAVEFCGRGDEGPVAVEFMPVNRLADLPILLNEAFNVRDEDDTVVFAATRRFSLLAVVRGVLDELTFLGSPAERDEAMSDLRSRMENIDDEECLTIEEVRDEWERRSEEDRRKFPCRSCGADSRCACFGKPPDLCHDCFNRMREN